jgi:hypothetical protein
MYYYRFKLILASTNGACPFLYYNLLLRRCDGSVTVVLVTDSSVTVAFVPTVE